jgi:hypothetical protein
MNRKEYNSDPRYAKILEQMDLLGIMDVTTTKQHKNGTIIWKLPIKMYGKYIKVGSFKSGYVRRLECIGYRSDSSYQLNKRCESEPQYYEILEWDSKADMNCKRTGKYRKFTTRTCKLIPNEVDRLEYLISYCLKNYYIKGANMVENGEFIPKWKYEHDLETMERVTSKIGWRYGNEDEISVTINGHRYKVK